MMPKTGSYFRVEYYACVVMGLPFPHSNVMSMKHSILLHNSKRMDRKLKTRVERVAGCTTTLSPTRIVSCLDSRPVVGSFIAAPAHEAVEKKFLMKGDRRARFEAHLDKTFFYLDEESITITCNIDNRSSKSRVHAISVTVLEILGESQVCREIVKRGAGGVGRWQVVADQGALFRPDGDNERQGADQGNDDGQDQQPDDDGEDQQEGGAQEEDGEEMELHEEGDDDYDKNGDGESPEVEERPAWAGRRRGSLGSSDGGSSAPPPLPGRRRNSIASGEESNATRPRRSSTSSASSSSSSSAATPSQTHDVIRRSSLGGAGNPPADPQAFMQRRRNSLAGEPGANRRGAVGNGAAGRYPEMGRRLGEKRVYHVQVEAGTMMRGVELAYPVRWGDVLGESLFNTATFHQTYLLVISFHMSFGRVDPRVRIPIFLIKRC
jgi:hypothetical protein